jgi:hypothetical protein
MRISLHPLASRGLALALFLFAAVVSAEEGGEPDAKAFSDDQIEQLVAPIALYPDALIAQVLIASTYPLEIVQAERWLGDHEGLEGDALQQAVDAEAWDDSVKALVFFPSVLEFMGDNLDWTQDLGDAVLAQQGDVTNTVQRLRDEAVDAGTLESNEQQRVEQSGDTIIIQPAEPEVVYVPTYDPVAAYGQSSPPSTEYYPDAYADAVSSYEQGYAAGLSTSTTEVDTSSGSGGGFMNFGAGALVGGLLTAAILWDDDDDERIYYGGRGYYGAPTYWSRPAYWNNNGWREPANISVDRNVNLESGAVNINRGVVGNEFDRTDVKRWQHNPEHRGGVRYRDNSTEKRFAERRAKGTIDRDVARGKVANAGERLKAPDLSKIQREGAASGGLAKLNESRGDGARLSGLKEQRGGSGEARAKLENRAPAAKAKAPAAKTKVQAKAPAAKAKAKAPKARPKATHTKPKVAAAAKKRPVNRNVERPKVNKAKAARPKTGGSAKARPKSGSAFKAKSKPKVTRKASNRGGASRARSGGGGRARRRG